MHNDKKMIISCDGCKTLNCLKQAPDPSRLPDHCPMRYKKSVVDRAMKMYCEKEIGRLYTLSTILEKEAYERVRGKTIPVRPRVYELIKLAKKMEATNVGMAYCVGLRKEASRVTDIFRKHGLVLNSIQCKCGAFDKTALGLKEQDKIEGPNKFEAACNPIVQAEILNDIGTGYNIILGLCVGHDMIFTKFSKAPVTTLIVKDRVTGHNPMSSLFSAYLRNDV